MTPRDRHQAEAEQTDDRDVRAFLWRPGRYARPLDKEAALPGWVRLTLVIVAVTAPVLVALGTSPVVRAPVVVVLMLLGPGVVLVPRMGLPLSSSAVLVPVVSLSVTTVASLVVVYAFPSSGGPDPSGIGGWSTLAVVTAVAVVVVVGAALPGRRPDVEVVIW